ncbi:MAG: FAD binding domain-containing protein [Magnetospirillum sp.]|jgi:carbon-monoxide dehydrogenase medium subunit|nr:FAD binding domain-containing protein [Magnetospirillum sp.]
MKPAPFTHHNPKTLAEAISLLSVLAPEDGRIIAGGQTLVPMMAFRLARPRHVIDINGITELGKITIENGTMTIGATVRHNAFEKPYPGSGKLGSLLANVVQNIAHAPIRSRGTFCGSIANSDPASEWCLVSTTAGAEIVLASVRGERIVPAHDFYTGIMANALAEDEIITKVRIPLLSDDTRFGFHEVSRRKGDFAMAACLAIYRLSNGKALEPRIGLGGVQAIPKRVTAAEEALRGGDIGGELFRQTASVAMRAIDPLDDEEFPEQYRRELAQAVVARALESSVA